MPSGWTFNASNERWVGIPREIIVKLPDGVKNNLPKHTRGDPRILSLTLRIDHLTPDLTEESAGHLGDSRRMDTLPARRDTRRVVHAFADVAFVPLRQECMGAHGVGPATPLEQAGRT